MTTIAWDGESIASDSQMTGDFKSIDQQKVFKLKKGPYRGAYAGGCGAVTAINQMVEMLEDGEYEAIDADDDLSATVMVALDSCALLFHSSSTGVIKVAPPYAVGSGAPFAITAMDCGKTAAEAVAAAIKRDPNSGGAVQVFSTKRRKK